MILCSVVLRSYTLIPNASICLHEDTVKQTLRTQKSQVTFLFFQIKLCRDSTEQIYYAYSCFKLSPMYICTDDSLSLSLYKMNWAQLFKRWITLSTGYIIVQLFFLMLIRRWIVIYPVNSANQSFNNGGLECKEASSM